VPTRHDVLPSCSVSFVGAIFGSWLTLCSGLLDRVPPSVLVGRDVLGGLGREQQDEPVFLGRSVSVPVKGIKSAALRLMILESCVGKNVSEACSGEIECSSSAEGLANRS
jgi:hypothetical protein